MHVGVPIWWWLIFSKPSNPRFRGKVVQKCPIWGHHTQIHDFTALNAGIRRERKIYFWNHLYHHDHDGRLIPASYVVPKINEYLILRNIYFFAPKSLLVGTPTGYRYFYFHYMYSFSLSLSTITPWAFGKPRTPWQTRCFQRCTWRTSKKGGRPRSVPPRTRVFVVQNFEFCFERDGNVRDKTTQPYRATSAIFVFWPTIPFLVYLMHSKGHPPPPV